MPLHYEHEECIELFMLIHDSQQVTRISLCKNLRRSVNRIVSVEQETYRKNILQGRLQQFPELVLVKQLE